MRKSSLRHSITEASFSTKRQPKDKKVKIVLTPVNNDVIGSFKKKHSVGNIRLRTDPKNINYDEFYEDRDVDVIKEESIENEDPLMKVKRMSLRGKELAKMRKTLQQQNHNNLNFDDLYEDRDEKVVIEEEKLDKDDPLMKVKRMSLRGKELAKMRKTLQQQNKNLNFDDLYEDRDEKVVKEEMKKAEEEKKDEEKEDPLMKVKRMSLRGKELAKLRKTLEQQNQKKNQKNNKPVNKNFKRLNTDFGREEAVMDELSVRFFGPRKISNLDEITINTIGINPSVEVSLNKNYYMNKKLKEEKKKRKRKRKRKRRK